MKRRFRDLLRRLLVRAAAGSAVFMPRPTPAQPNPPPAVEDPASYLQVEWHLQAHREQVNVSADELAQAWRNAEDHWSREYRDLPAQLAAVTRRRTK
jgi:hypothetical protein